ncbi:MAG: sodium:alanine symporter [Candidatus Epulonipiscioides saccharophilum]|nr:MAG: sodium:alanine symporter [Epulopiscium sp. AS2M-Bin001]
MKEEIFMTEFLTKINDIVWGVPLITLILFCGILLTIRLKGIQITQLWRALKYMFKNEEGGMGEISSFSALCTALSATIGTGNIVGVASAISAGGPGALFWMEIAAFFGMATKYAEGFLAIRYREIDSNNHVLGGPFYYIEKGMGIKYKWLAKSFAVFGCLAGLLGIGTITQINGITSAAQNFFDPDKSQVVFYLGAQPITLTIILVGFIVTLCAALVIIGGIKRISSVAGIVVPFMAIIYFALGIIIIVVNFQLIPSAIYAIIIGAFSPQAIFGGVLGITIKTAIQKGVARGIFSNEAGLGSAPIAAAAASTKDPVRQGLVTMTGTFIDTIIICTITGLAIVMTGAWLPELNLAGAEITMFAFQEALPFSSNISSFLLMSCLVFFAFTTILGWNYYAEKCIEYLSNNNKTFIRFYRIAYIFMIFVGPYMTVAAVWTTADIFNGLMAIPNTIALIFLSKSIASETNLYCKNLKLKN